MRTPHLIALCGNPGAGKSEVQKILWEKYKVVPVDDGHVLRAFAVNALGLSWDDVQTQEGKKRSTVILDEAWEHRKILGELGNRLEGLFGEHIIPYIATRNLDPKASYSFGSVRKTQGQFFRKAGGLVIEVKNSYAPPSGNAFDVYDKSAIDITISNDVAPAERGDVRVRQHLEDSVAAALEAAPALLDERLRAAA